MRYELLISVKEGGLRRGRQQKYGKPGGDVKMQNLEKRE